MAKRITCDDATFVMDGFASVVVCPKVFAYICPACDHTHLAVDSGGNTMTVVSLHEDQAHALSKMLIDPPTLETVHD